MNNVILIMLGLFSGMVMATAVVAFITAVGVVPRLAQKTKTCNFAIVYETAILSGLLAGTLFSFYTINLPPSSVLAVVTSLAGGIFFGALAMSLAEVLNVIPILMRRMRLKSGLFYFVIAIALGKLAGALIYFIVGGFNS